MAERFKIVKNNSFLLKLRLNKQFNEFEKLLGTMTGSERATYARRYFDYKRIVSDINRTEIDRDIAEKLVNSNIDILKTSHLLMELNRRWQNDTDIKAVLNHLVDKV